MSGKKVCLNCSTSYYTGREQSPLHFGLSAEGYEINSIMEGFDKELWIVDIKNNKKVWTKKEHINKMTYEKPLITEFSQDNHDNGEGNTQTTAHNDSVDDVALAANTNTTISISNANANANANAIANANDNSVAVVDNANNSKSTGDITSKDESAAIAKSKASKSKASKTNKTTDYTLFITYRIAQMKHLSNDNKKNYDCAREEWKEYKKKPEELKAVMVEAINFSKSKL